MWRRAMVIAASALLALVLLASAVDRFWPAPRELALTAPSAPVGERPLDAADVQGTWAMARGSIVGYRVWERDVLTPHLAVARTGDVTGSVRLAAADGRVEMQAVDVAARLAGLRSIDTKAGPVADRDDYVSDHLDVGRYPLARFSVDGPILLPAGVRRDHIVALTVPGKLTVHGRTRPVHASIQAELTARGLLVAGGVPTRMTDFDVPAPVFPPFTYVEPALTLEFALRFVRA